jgi:hypothetical protein
MHIWLGESASLHNYHRLESISTGADWYRGLRQTWPTAIAFDLPLAACITSKVYFQTLPATRVVYLVHEDFGLHVRFGAI